MRVLEICVVVSVNGAVSLSEALVTMEEVMSEVTKVVACAVAVVVVSMSVIVVVSSLEVVVAACVVVVVVARSRNRNRIEHKLDQQHQKMRQ